MRVVDESSPTPTPSDRVRRFESLAFGLFIHWGLYSALGRGEWVLFHERIPLAEYDQLKDSFEASEFHPEAIADLAVEAGVKYITLTARHHDGFSLYDTRGLSTHDSVHAPAHRDLVGEFVAACQRKGVVPCLYHTTLDWRWEGKQTKTCSESDFNRYLDYLHQSLRIMCSNYGPLGSVFFDGDWCRPESDWRLDERYAIIREHQPDAVIINNTGIHRPGLISHQEIDSVTFEQSRARPVDRRGHTKYVTGEMNQTMNSHWGVGSHDLNFKSVPQLIEYLAHCRKVGANYLLNVGPEFSGRIPDLEAAMLRKIGAWSNLVGDPLYRGRPVPGVVCQGRDFVLAHNDRWYYFAHDISIVGDHDVTLASGGAGPRVISGLDSPVASARWIDNDQGLAFTQHPDKGFATIDCTGYPYGTSLVVRVAELTFAE